MQFSFRPEARDANMRRENSGKTSVATKIRLSYYGNNKRDYHTLKRAGCASIRGSVDEETLLLKLVGRRCAKRLSRNTR